MVAEVIHNRTLASGSRGALCLILGAALLAPGSVSALERGEFDSSSFDAQLVRHVHDGKVDYAAWKDGDREALLAYLDAAKDYDLTGIMGKEPKAAFLINVYNAWVVLQILDHFPVASVDEIPGMFDQNTRVIAGEEMTLDGLEEKLDFLLPHKPQFALALAHGTRGGPKLEPQAFASENFDKLLGRYAQSYLVDEKQVQYRPKNNQLLLPPEILKYMHRYQSFPSGLAEPFSNILPLEVLVALNAHQPEYIIQEPDRSLNTLDEPELKDTGENRDK